MQANNQNLKIGDQNKFKNFIQAQEPSKNEKKYPKQYPKRQNYKQKQKPQQFKRQKSEFMILGTKEEINELVVSQARFVGEKYDIDGGLGAIPLNKIPDKPKQFDTLENIYNHKKDLQNYMLGKQCEWLNLENNNWKEKVCKFTNSKNLDNTYVLGVSFKGIGKYYDGNPFVGGTVDSTDTNIIDGGLRELKEEIGLGVKPNYKTNNLLDYQGIWNNKFYDRTAIQMIHAKDVLNLNDAQPIQIR